MSKLVFIALGVTLLCGMTVLGSLGADQRGTETARLAAPTEVVTAPITY